jgi:hypothetical protein
MVIMQSIHEPVDVAGWLRDEEFAEYPEGAREKTLIYCPSPSPYAFLIAGHRYVFKLSSRRYAEQYWMEIIAYKLGIQMGVTVPPAFVAFDSKRGQSGTLIEWFLRRIDSSGYETYVPGGDYCQQYIPNFQRKKGEQHNFETVTQIFSDLGSVHQGFQDDWKNYWARTLAFDSLIGNTDRHQDNWGVIINPINNEMHIAPVFDNGTSLGHEISAVKFNIYDEYGQLERYVSRGWHHMKWSLTDETSMLHLDMLQRLASKYPDTRLIMLESLSKVNEETFSKILATLVAFDVPVKLTTERADFMLKLIQYRHKRLLNGLEI